MRPLTRNEKIAGGIILAVFVVVCLAAAAFFYNRSVAQNPSPAAATDSPAPQAEVQGLTLDEIRAAIADEVAPIKQTLGELDTRLFAVESSAVVTTTVAMTETVAIECPVENPRKDPSGKAIPYYEGSFIAWSMTADGQVVSWMVCQEDGTWLEVFQDPSMNQTSEDTAASGGSSVESAKQASEAVSATGTVSTTATMGWETEWYRSPWRDTTKQLADELTHETFAEPGMFPGMKMSSGEWAQTAWDKMNQAEEPILVPEAGYTYQASNGYCVDVVNPEASDKAGTEVREHLFCLPKVGERVYLTFYRGLPSDGGDADLNRVVVVYDYTRGAAINHVIEAGAYVSLDWTVDQVKNAQEVPGRTPQDPKFHDPMCGDNGCKQVLVVAIDLKTATVRIWDVSSGNWVRVEALEELNPTQ